MDIYISFALVHYIYVIDFISHVKLDIMIWQILSKQGGMKELCSSSISTKIKENINVYK